MDISFNGMDMLILAETEGWFALEDIDLTGVSTINLMAGWQEPPAVGFDFEVRLDAPDGELAGSGSMNPPLNGQNTVVNIPLQAEFSGKKNLYVHYKKQQASEEPVMVALMNATFN
jgi:hypothetical protein